MSTNVVINLYTLHEGLSDPSDLLLRVVKLAFPKYEENKFEMNDLSIKEIPIY